MEPLYQLKFQMTAEEHLLFNRVILRQQFHLRRNAIIINLFFLLGFLGFCIASFLTSSTAYIAATLFYLCFGIYYNWKITKGVDRKAQKAYEQNKALQDLKIATNFFTDHLEIISEYDNTNLPYDKIIESIETQTHIYLLISKVQGYLIPKQSMPSDFSKFIETTATKYNWKQSKS